MSYRTTDLRMPLFFISLLIFFVACWVLLFSGPETTRVVPFGGDTFFSFSNYEKVKLSPPYNFIETEKILNENIRFLEENNLASGPVDLLGWQDTLDKRHSKLINLRNEVICQSIYLVRSI